MAVGTGACRNQTRTGRNVQNSDGCIHKCSRRLHSVLLRFRIHSSFCPIKMPSLSKGDFDNSFTGYGIMHFVYSNKCHISLNFVAKCQI